MPCRQLNIYITVCEMNLPESKFSVIILAAGNGSRIGQSKAFLTHPTGELFVSYLVSVYVQSRADQICVVIQDRDQDQFRQVLTGVSQTVRICVNAAPQRGRMSSVQTGLQTIPDHHYVFVQNVDNPFCTLQWIEQLLAPPMFSGTRIPWCEAGGGHPVLISPNVCQGIRSALPDAVLRDIISQFPTSHIPISDFKIRANINTPDDYAFWMTSK